METSLLGSPLLHMLFSITTGATIGYLLQCLLILSVVYPVHPVTIGPSTLQSYLLRRKHALSTALGDYIARELALIINTSKKQQQDAIKTLCSDTLRQWVDTFLQTHLQTIHPMAGALIKGKLGLQLHDILLRELERLLTCIAERISSNSVQEVNIAALVRERINHCSMENLTQAVQTHFTHEIRLLRRFGTASGALTGLCISIAAYVM